MTGSSRTSMRRAAGYAALVGLAYAGLSQLVATFAAASFSVGAVFWPGAGLTLGVLLGRPRREWPLYVGAVFVAEALMDVRLGFSPVLGLQWGLANTAGPLAGAWLLTRGGRRAPDIGTRHDLRRFLAFGVVAGPALAALIGAAAGVLVAGDPWWPRLPRWFVGDAVGALAVAPAVLLVACGGLRRPSWRLLGGGALLFAGTLLTVGPWEFEGRGGLPFLVVPGLIAFAVLSGTAGAAAGALVVSFAVAGITTAGLGPFADEGAFSGLLVAQMFVVMAALSSLTVAALIRDLVSRERLDEQLRAQALTDNLTGLANRRLLFDRLDRASKRLARTPGRVGLLFVDLDHFKQVNDTLGHLSGDAVLIEVGRRLSALVRDHDTVARLGGDEFLILVEDLAAESAVEQLAERAIRGLSEPIACPGGVAHVTASVGYALAHEPFGEPGKFLMRADRAMYRAKQAGGGRTLAAT
jgi:diguanylate cyclase (GGDEF)-like protein